MRQDSRAFMGLPFVSHDLDSSHALLCQEQKNKATAKRTKGGGRQKARAKLLRRGEFTSAAALKQLSILLVTAASAA